jgi:hypothetical protein
MKPRIDIVVVVDVIGALSDETLLGNLWMMDNGSGQSTGQGTPELSTACCAGQLIKWAVRAVDLQTPVEIGRITFPGGCAEQAPAEPASGSAGPTDRIDLGLNVWSGVVPPYLTAGTTYRYTLELHMYEGRNSVMSIDSPSLRCAQP